MLYHACIMHDPRAAVSEPVAYPEFYELVDDYVADGNDCDDTGDGLNHLDFDRLRHDYTEVVVRSDEHTRPAISTDGILLRVRTHSSCN